MELLPLTLTACRGNWQRFSSRKQNKAFSEIQERVFKRDNATCRYCGFQSGHFQEVINADHNYSNNNLDNLMTACCFCAQCFFVESIGLDARSGGVVIQLPEISQADLNHFCRVLFCSLQRDAPYKGKLQAVYLSLKDRGQAIEQAFGPETSNPSVFGQAMIDSGLTKEQKNQVLMQSLRLLPARKPFKAQIDYWQSTVFANIPL